MATALAFAGGELDMQMRAAVIAILGIAVVVGGCGSPGSAAITVVRQHSTGGELELRGTVVASHHAAEDAMLLHCARGPRCERLTANGGAPGPGADVPGRGSRGAEKA